MPSTYTSRLRLTLPATGELNNIWGSTVNSGITELVDASVSGAATLSTWGGAGVAYTLSNNNGVADEARCMFLLATGAPGENKNIICPSVTKLYVLRNAVSGGFTVTLKTLAGAGITVRNGATMVLWCDGTDVVEAVTQLGAVTHVGTQTFTGAVVPATNTVDSVGYTGIPHNAQSANYTLVASDAGKGIVHPITDNNPRTFTIPANGTVAYPVGTTITFINLINTVTIAITSDTMYLSGIGTTGSRSLAAYGVAVAQKVTSTSWIISGNGLT